MSEKERSAFAYLLVGTIFLGAIMFRLKEYTALIGMAILLGLYLVVVIWKWCEEWQKTVAEKKAKKPL